MTERRWSAYFRQAQKYLYCTRHDQKTFEARIRSAVRDLENEQPGITFEQCVKIVGSPEEAAREYMEGFSTEYLAEQRRGQILWTRLLFCGALCALAALLFSCWRLWAASAGLGASGPAEESGTASLFGIPAASFVWLAVLLVLIVCEAVTLNLVTIWFAVGAAAAMIVSAFSVTPRVQFMVFVIVSVASLAVVYPFAKQCGRSRRVRTNADRNIGRQARALTDLAPGEPGRVRLDGVDWQARCAQPLPAGALCEVERVDGTTLTVRAAAPAGKR